MFGFFFNEDFFNAQFFVFFFEFYYKSYELLCFIHFILKGEHSDHIGISSMCDNFFFVLTTIYFDQFVSCFDDMCF